MGPALALLEFATIAAGIEAGDAMVKRAPLDVVLAGSVQPGRYLVLVSGDVACVEEAVAAGVGVGRRALVDRIVLPQVHPAVVDGLAGRRWGEAVEGIEALGIVETSTVAAVIGGADAGVKAAEVDLVEVRLADGLNGKGYALFGGPVADVQAAVEAAVASLAQPDLLVERVVIPRLHPEMLANLRAGARFSRLLRRGVPGPGSADATAGGS